MIQNNYFTDNEDILLQFESVVPWKEIVEAYESGFRDAAEFKKTQNENLAMAPADTEEAVEYYKAILESMGEISGKTVAPASQIMDRKGLRFENGKVIFPDEMIKCFETIRDAGLLPFSVRRTHGGMGVPVVIQSMYLELLSRADASLALTFGAFNLSETIERFGSPEIIDEWIPKMTAGDACGAMALTEPNYGSNLAGVQTLAAKQKDGTWLLNGTKLFITHGCGFADKPSVILTLARTGSPDSGARGLSFFIVDGKNVQVAGIETKMGIHCSPTCQLVYENSPGILMGEEGYGLIKYAMGMMNTARLSIAAQSLGLATAAYYEAKKYASERIQFDKEIEKIPAVARMLNRMEREISGMRGFLLEASRLIDGYLWKKEFMAEEGKTDKEIRKDPDIRNWEKLADLFTPLVKYYLSEECIAIASDAVQIHGGSGYTEDYDVARIFRDARITSIYEGTSQMQVVGGIGSVISGMSSAGNLRKYIEDAKHEFKFSDHLLQVEKTLEEAVEEFKSFEEDELKERLASEIIKIAVRFLAGLVFEKSLTMLEGDFLKKRKMMSDAYQIDSIALCTASLLMLKNRAM